MSAPPEPLHPADRDAAPRPVAGAAAPTGPAAPGAGRTSIAAACLLAGGAALIVFAQATGFELLDLGDRDRLLTHDRWHGFADGRLAWMASTVRGGVREPLTWASYALDHTFGGGTPEALHRTNVLLHALTTALLSLLVVRVARATGRAPSRATPFLAGAAAAVWALHPLRVEPVAWVADRGVVLAALFGTVAALGWIAGRTHAGRAGVVATGVAATAAAAAALADPWAGAGIPVAVIALDRWLATAAGGRQALPRARRPGATAAVAVPVALVVVASWSVRPPGAAEGIVARVTLAAHEALQPLRDCVATATLHPVRSAPAGFPEALAVPLLLDAAIVGLLAVAALWALRRGRGAGFAALAYAGLVAGSALRPGVASAADAHLATAALVVAGSAWANARRPGAAAVAATALAAGLGFLTTEALPAWRTSESLAAHVLAHDPRNDTAAALRGDAVRRAEGPDAEAEAWYRRGADEGDGAGGGRSAPRCHTGLGALALVRGDADAAERHLARATEQAPGLAEAWRLLGTLHLQRGRPAEAERAFTRATRLDDRSSEAWYGLGRAALALDRPDVAREAFDRVISIVPADPGAREGLATVEGILRTRRR